MSDKVTAVDIKKALSMKHCKEFFITECKNGSTYFAGGDGLFKFDGVAIYKSWTSPKIVIYEVKVDRGDFLRDGKYHCYLPYCHEMYFVVPTGMVKKEEILSDNIGLIYYNHETGALRTVKKALYRNIEISTEMLLYIFMNRLDSDRIPFYSDKLEYAKDYIANQKEKRYIGNTLGTKMAADISEMQKQLDDLSRGRENIGVLKEIKRVMEKHDIHTWGDNIADTLDEALSKSYPQELEYIAREVTRIKASLERIMDRKKVPDAES